MSYDLLVYSARGLTLSDLEELVEASPSLAIGESRPASEGEPAFLMVARGQRRTYCFTVEGLWELDPEDVPVEVTAAVLGPRFLYQVISEGTEEDAATAHAVRFARKLAKEAGGAVYDVQTGEVWPKKSARSPVPPRKEMQTDIVEVQWHIPAVDCPKDLAARFLEVAHRYLPEALPRRYGVYEPFQGRFEKDGDEGFLGYCASRPGSIVLHTGTYPVGLGMIELPEFRRQMGVVSLTLDREPLKAGGPWLNALQKLFVEFCLESKCAFGSAEVLRNYTWTSRWFASNRSSEKAAVPSYFGKWTGLPAYPQWLAWYGPDYAELIGPHLHGKTERHQQALLHSWGDLPQSRDELLHRLSDSGKSSIPPKFSPSWSADGELVRTADIIPDRLRNPE